MSSDQLKALTDVYIALVDQVTKQERPFLPRWSMCFIVFASQTTQKKNKNKNKNDFSSKKLSGDLKAQSEPDEQHIYLVVI